MAYLNSKAKTISDLNDTMLWIADRYCLVPEKKISIYRRTLEDWRPHLTKELEIGLILKPINVDEDGVDYLGDDNKPYRIDVDWQVCSEMTWGFTSVNWVQGIIEYKHPEIYEYKTIHTEPTWWLTRIKEVIDQNEWRFAKTQPKNPHYYALRKKWVGDVPFDILLLFIREYGYNTIFRGWNYRNLDIDNFTYWSMGAPSSLSILINRKEIV